MKYHFLSSNQSLKLRRKPINALLAVRVSKSCISPFSVLRAIASILEISTISMLKHKEESPNGRSWCLQDPLQLRSYLHRLKLIWEHLDRRYVDLFPIYIYIYMFSMISLLFCNTCLSVAIDLESLG